ncbi:hypothetical protein BU26DRAFT_525581 [Trematosphaeria pertusa]|uniref:Uncharacterized protein n=1 Tax=Trematosphaeria pertusa TaxID=390896 RepID=A0A6A6HSB0_9PLEO|nr:uncharacterized protein BU26DRAFT_525581 [Trematosphaeria pertusa]KAF2241055.1 hypothetical protein BU26DRAFT_525581 [Trematosphaeria pertusa]
MAAAYGKWELKGFEPHAYDPNENPGCIPATFEAMKKLLPKGWKVLYDLDKAWLRPMFKAFTLSDAQERADAEKEMVQKQLCRELGLPESEFGRVRVSSVVEETREILAEIDGDVLEASMNATRVFQVDTPVGVHPDYIQDPMTDGDFDEREGFVHGRFDDARV